jgi:hypothetical protein
LSKDRKEKMPKNSVSRLVRKPFLQMAAFTAALPFPRKWEGSKKNALWILISLSLMLEVDPARLSKPITGSKPLFWHPPWAKLTISVFEDALQYFYRCFNF